MTIPKIASCLLKKTSKAGSALIRPPMAILLFLVLIGQSLFAQPSPVVQGDSLLCPNSTGIVYTQQFDSYQWYQRPYGGSFSTAIPGATSPTLTVDYSNFAGSYVSVFVTQNGDTATSPEFLVDGVAFLPPAVMTVGDFRTGTNGETIICEGDSVFLVLQMPYDTLIQWFEGGVPIQGANSSTLIVMTAGDYTVEGAPHDCPGFLQPLGLTLRVETENCATAINPEMTDQVYVAPSHASDQLRILYFGSYDGDWQYEVVNQLGQSVMKGTVRSGETLNVSDLRTAVYWIKLASPAKVQTRVFMKG